MGEVLIRHVDQQGPLGQIPSMCVEVNVSCMWHAGRCERKILVACVMQQFEREQYLYGHAGMQKR